MSLFRRIASGLASLFGGRRAPSAEVRKQGGVMAFLLLQNEAVQAELKLDVEQIGKIMKIIRESRQENRQGGGGLRGGAGRRGKGGGRRGGGGQNLQERREQSNKRLMAVAEKALANIQKAEILKPEQRDRLQQIAWQNRGAIVFQDPTLQEALHITEGQGQVLLTLAEEISKRLREVRHDEDEEFADAEKQERVAAIRQEGMERMLAVLTEPQRSRWEELKGAPFEVDLDGGKRRPRHARG